MDKHKPFKTLIFVLSSGTTELLMTELFEHHQEVQPVEHVFRLWTSDETVSENIWKVVRIPAKPADFVPLPDNIHPQLKHILEKEGIRALYRHQQHAWETALTGKSMVIATGTASGKTLCFNLPVLDACFHQECSRALYIYPTKALAQDQYENLVHWLKGSSITAAVYDGDTPTNQRSAIRSRANIVLTNPDMLHMGILPHHTRWEALFRNLHYIVIDEVHTYRGVFGSHLANLLRRLKRVARFYGSTPQFIFTSATIGNPAEHASRLAEQPIELIDDDGAPQGEKLFLIYNPPVLDPSLGIRASAMQESQRLLRDLISCEIQTIVSLEPVGLSKFLENTSLTSIRKLKIESLDTAVVIYPTNAVKLKKIFARGIFKPLLQPML